MNLPRCSTTYHHFVLSNRRPCKRRASTRNKWPTLQPAPRLQPPNLHKRLRRHLWRQCPKRQTREGCQPRMISRLPKQLKRAILLRTRPANGLGTSMTSFFSDALFLLWFLLDEFSNQCRHVFANSESDLWTSVLADTKIPASSPTFRIR